jgi:hypothetical protein
MATVNIPRPAPGELYVASQPVIQEMAVGNGWPVASVLP